VQIAVGEPVGLATKREQRLKQGVAAPLGQPQPGHAGAGAGGQRGGDGIEGVGAGDRVVACTVTLIGMSSRAVSFGSAAMDQLWGVDISGGSVERGNLIPDREAIGHHLSVVGRRQQVPTDPEMWRNAAERRQEPLGMPG